MAKKPTPEPKKTPGRSSALEKARAAKVKKNAGAKAATDKTAVKARDKAAAGVALLNPIAKEIRARLASASKADNQALDKRTSAAIFCGQARVIAENHGVSFRKWWGAEVEAKMPEGVLAISYKSAIELSAIGIEAKGDEEKAKVLMLEHRSGVATRSRSERAVKKKGGGSSPSTQAKSSTALESLDRAFSNFTGDLGEDAEAKYLKARAKKLGLVVNSKAQAVTNELAAVFDNLITQFRGLPPSERMKFVEWAALEVGAAFTLPDVGGMDAGEDGMDIPKSMQRGNGRGGKRQSSTA